MASALSAPLSADADDAHPGNARGHVLRLRGGACGDGFQRLPRDQLRRGCADGAPRGGACGRVQQARGCESAGGARSSAARRRCPS